MNDSSLSKKMALIDKLQLTESELATLLEFDDKQLRIELLVGIFQAIYMSSPPAPDALIHFFTVPSKEPFFEGKSVKQFLLDSPSLENLERTYMYFMARAI